MSFSSMRNLVPVPSQPSASSSNPASSLNPTSSSNPPGPSNAAIFDSLIANQPLNRLWALWHPTSGLVVSPNANYVPEAVPTRHDYTAPSLLSDSEIYLAFRPRFPRNAGDLFGRLNLNRQAIGEKIITFSNGQSALNDETRDSWERLEIALLDVVDTLLKQIKPIPTLEYPKFPWKYGYTHTHATREITYKCVLRSRDAFMTLAGLVTFALSLYMDESGGLERAYMTLMAKSSYKVHPAWLDLLMSSYVCNFSPHFRVGGYINPYTSDWMRFIPNFVQAQVPIWILWGHNCHKVGPATGFGRAYIPSQRVIAEAQARSAATTSLILPTYRHDPFAMNQGIPLPIEQNADDDSIWAVPEPMSIDEPFSMTPPMPATLQSSSPSSSTVPLESTPPSSSLARSEEVRKQDALAALEKFFDDMQRRRDICLARELPVEKQRREAREESAKTQKPSKKSAVYIWEEQDDGTYRRAYVNSKQVSSEWSNFTENQRRFTGHLNQWDLCPQLPRYSADKPKVARPYDSDASEYEGSDDESALPPPARNTTIEFPDVQAKVDTYAEEVREPEAVRDLNAMEVDNVDHVNELQTFDFEAHLRDRFGYDHMSPHTWSAKIKPAPQAEGLAAIQAMRALSYNMISKAPNVTEAAIRLVEILSNATWTFADLPASFDYSPDNARPLSLASDTLAITMVPSMENLFYIVHRTGHVDESPWSIGTWDASTVLLIFRKQWPTVEVIARELVRRGTPFRTVAAIEESPAPRRYMMSQGLGARSAGYKPTVGDYEEYVRRRDDLLRGPKGRAALLHGGIVARLARDVVEPNTVLDGPSSDARPVAYYGRFTLVDDELTDQDLDIICGVYYVKLANAPVGDNVFLPGTRAELSWWPQHAMWVTSTCYPLMEWSELAEEFYQQKLEDIRTRLDTVACNSSKWRSRLRKANTLTALIAIGIEHYQSGFLEDHLRKNRFIAEHH